jgi:antitoxin component YwqK of YwqJK toxin-antitoxin module
MKLGNKISEVKNPDLLVQELEKAVKDLKNIRDSKKLIKPELLLDESGNGFYTVYYGNGSVFTELYYENFEKHGLVKSYHYGPAPENPDKLTDLSLLPKSYGSLRLECNYSHNVYHGYMVRYHNNGNLALEVNIIHGEKDGIYKDYYESGNLRNLEYYIFGKRHGTIKTYYDRAPSGRFLKCSYECIDGNFDGISIHYLINGVLQKEGHYKNNKVDGLCKYYDEKGLLKQTKLYKDGELIEEKTF